MNSLILASASPRRRKLINLLPFSFEFIAPNCDENVHDFLSPSDFALQLARRKADTVAANHPGKVVIGCDTIVVLKNQILGKPESETQAFNFLQELSGNQHEVITAFHITLYDHDKNPVRYFEHAEQTTVEFGVISEQEITKYISSGTPMDKAGAYGIQDDYGALFVKQIIGDYYNVVGLPLFSLNNALKDWFNENE